MQSREFRRLSATACAISLALLAATQSACAPPAETISGEAKVIDGDSLEIGATRIRLHAIDAFEGRQTCYRGSAAWDCGAVATRELRRLVGTQPIACERIDIDSYGRTVAICRNGDSDLGAEMVRAGLALAYREFGDDYVDEEEEAQQARSGAWAGTFTAPWDERHGTASPRSERTSAPSKPATPNTGVDCRGTGIKANINREGERIYHVPSSRWYDDTDINESKGERWFCSEDEARRAGWRAARN